MVCQICKENPATIRITEIPKENWEASEADPKGHLSVEERLVCEDCAKNLNLPHAPVVQKSMVKIWKLIQQSARKAREEGGLSCPDCGMTLSEFRSKGRLGCPRDYEVFEAHLTPLLQRIHNATEHHGRLPGMKESEWKKQEHLSQLQARLEEAVREEAYESAARLRDEIQALQ